MSNSLPLLRYCTQTGRGQSLLSDAGLPVAPRLSAMLRGPETDATKAGGVMTAFRAGLWQEVFSMTATLDTAATREEPHE